MNGHEETMDRGSICDLPNGYKYEPQNWACNLRIKLGLKSM